MKQTMHERFLASDKQRKNDRNVLTLAARERREAEEMRDEARQMLWNAQRLLEDAQLMREGWTKSSASDEWSFSRWERWRHSSGFDIVRSVFEGKIIWSAYQLQDPDAPNVANDADELEATLEWCRLKLINMGRYPEPPAKGLFERLCSV